VVVLVIKEVIQYFLLLLLPAVAAELIEIPAVAADQVDLVAADQDLTLRQILGLGAQAIHQVLVLAKVKAVELVLEAGAILQIMQQVQVVAVPELLVLMLARQQVVQVESVLTLV
jgi:hypothetical protein